MPLRKPTKLAPIHPGEVLLADFVEPLSLSQYRLAHDVSVPPRRINEIVHGTRAITADTALRLARYFGTTERFWLNLQARFDLETQRDALGARLVRSASSSVPADERCSSQAIRRTGIRPPRMKVDYDEATDTLTVLLRDAPVAESDEDKPGVILDYDDQGNLVSIEILDASTRVTDPTSVTMVA